MGLFGKKKNQDVGENPAVETENPSPKKKAAKNRKKVGMSQVLNESVPATVEEELKENNIK